MALITLFPERRYLHSLKLKIQSRKSKHALIYKHVSLKQKFDREIHWFNFVKTKKKKILRNKVKIQSVLVNLHDCTLINLFNFPENN